MLNLAENIDRQAIWFSMGAVESVEAGNFRVQTENGPISARQAKGCLIKPVKGDRVLMVCAGDDAFILNVLESEDTEAPAVISYPGDVKLHASGTLNLLGRQVDVGGAESVRVKSSRFDLSCLKILARFEESSIEGRLIKLRLDKMKTVVNSLETRANRVFDRFKRHYRRIDEFEDSAVGRVRLRVKKLFSLHSKSATIQAEERVKMDADKIILG